MSALEIEKNVFFTHQAIQVWIMIKVLGGCKKRNKRDKGKWHLNYWEIQAWIKAKKVK